MSKLNEFLNEIKTRKDAEYNYPDQYEAIEKAKQIIRRQEEVNDKINLIAASKPKTTEAAALYEIQLLTFNLSSDIEKILEGE
jgi:hypothetical protein